MALFFLIFCTLGVIELLVSHAPSSRHICTIQDGTVAHHCEGHSVDKNVMAGRGVPHRPPPAAQMGRSSTNTEEEDMGPSIGVLW